MKMLREVIEGERVLKFLIEKGALKEEEKNEWKRLAIKMREAHGLKVDECIWKIDKHVVQGMTLEEIEKKFCGSL